MRTWWQPTTEDRSPWLEIDLRGEFDVSALRILWREIGLDYDAGHVPGPIGYRSLAPREIILSCHSAS